MTLAVSIAQGGANNVTFRNKIINGGMVIDQRNAGAAVTPTTAGYLVDRFQYQLSQASKATWQQNAGSVTPPTGFINYLGCTSTSTYSVLTGDFFRVYQPIEGLNVSDLAWGTANAATVTLSFWVRSSLTGTFGGSIQNSAGNRSYPFTYTISFANTWEQKTITVAGDTTGTWLTTNGVGILVGFGIGVGSTFSGTAGAWAGANYLSATGATSVVGTNGATWYITGVQLEAGTTASPFEYRQYGQEFDLCRRYYEQFNFVASTSQYLSGGAGIAWSSNDVRVYFNYYPKRTNPTMTWTGTVRFSDGLAAANLTSMSFDAPGVNTALMYNASTSGFTRGTALQVWVVSGTGVLTVSSEL